MTNEINQALRSLVEYICSDLDTDCMVVGSIALEICGFPMRREVHDIDIEVKDSTKARLALTALTKATNANHKEYDKVRNHIDFNWNGIGVNVWLVPELNKQHIWKDYIKYATINEVLKVKLGYGRSKDIKDLSFAVEEFFRYVNQ
jgi:CRISPR/Cas system-associated exonuclease Cas4 (RecB family)